MTRNALKALHQPDLLKRSMGNALGRFSSHPQPLSLSHRPCLSVSGVSPHAVVSAVHLFSPSPGFFPSAFLSCLPQLYPDSLSLSLHFGSCLPAPAPPSVAFELGL